MQRHRNYYDRGVSGSNRVYVLLLILIGILTAAFFIGGYRRANGNIDEYGNEITEGTSVELLVRQMLRLLLKNSITILCSLGILLWLGLLAMLRLVKLRNF